MKTIIFDVDDTLYSQIEPFNRAIEASFSERVHLSEIPLSQLYLDFRFFSDKVFHQTIDGSLSLEDMRVYRISEALKNLGYDITKAEAENFQKNYKAAQDNIVLQEDMEKLLIQLKANQTNLGILTNGPTNHQKDKVKQLDLSQYIKPEYTFISEEVGIAKPDPRVFEHIESVMGIEAKEIIYVGDSYENDVIGAKGAGWTCLWLNKYGKDISNEKVQPDVEMGGYQEITSVLEQLMNR